MSTRALMTGGVVSSIPRKKSKLLSNKSPPSTTSLSSSLGQMLPPSPSSATSLQLTKRERLFAAVNQHAATVVNEKYPNFDAGDLPQFSADEIVRGPELGSGFFGVVFEVQDIILQEEGGVEKAREQFENKRTRFFFVDKMLCRKKKAEDDSWRMNKKAQVDITAMMEEGEEDNEESFNKDEKLPASGPTDARSFMKQHCRRHAQKAEKMGIRKWTGRKNRSKNGQARYAIKVLNPEIFDDPTKLYYQGVMDLNSETRLLAKIQDHPNICKLRAIGKCHMNNDGASTTFHQEYFIVLDRLYCILDQRMLQWKQKSQRYGGIVGKLVLDAQAKRRKELWIERLCAGYGLASALAHIHAQNIVHRDLKVDNIGFDIRGDVKLFDFGLARELPKNTNDTNSCDCRSNSESEDWDQYSYGLSTGGNRSLKQYAYSTTWKMTGETGTPRYMAPETALNKPYNASCDTYSFCILLWQMLMLKTPFELYSAKAMWYVPFRYSLGECKAAVNDNLTPSFLPHYQNCSDRVWKAPHKRPPIDRAAWPLSVKRLLQEGWGYNLGERPPMERVAEVLRMEIISCQDDDDDFARFGQSLDKAERRSTFVFDPKAMNDVADVAEDDSVSICNSGIFSLRAISPFSVNRTKLSKSSTVTGASKELFSPHNRDDTNPSMDDSEMSSSGIHFSPTKRSDGHFPASSPFERTCASVVLPLLGLPLFDGDEGTNSESNEDDFSIGSGVDANDISSACLDDFIEVCSKSDLEDKLEGVSSQAFPHNGNDCIENANQESTLDCVCQEEALAVFPSEPTKKMNDETTVKNDAIQNAENCGENLVQDKSKDDDIVDKDSWSQKLKLPSRTSRTAAPALPYVSPSYEGGGRSTYDVDDPDHSSAQDEIQVGVHERRALLSAKSESLMIRIKELKKKQESIKARIALLHADEDDDGV
jgi:serine/threonine protein kinase